MTVLPPLAGFVGGHLGLGRGRLGGSGRRSRQQEPVRGPSRPNRKVSDSTSVEKYYILFRLIF